MLRNNLPNLIFAESNHIDPITSSVLTKLFQELQNFGYGYFLEEREEDIKIEEQICALERAEETYSALKQKTDALGIDIHDEANLEKISMFVTIPERLQQSEKNYALSTDQINFNKKFRIYNDLVLLIRGRSARLRHLELLKTCLKLNLKYFGIDLKDRNQIPLTEILSTNVSDLRDKCMADNLLKYPKSISRIGLAHVRGIQDVIFKKMSPDEARKKFYFFSIDNPLNEEEKKLKLKNLPLEIIQIDARNYSEDELVKMIIKKISKDIEKQKFSSSLLIVPKKKTNNVTNTFSTKNDQLNTTRNSGFFFHNKTARSDVENDRILATKLVKDAMHKDEEFRKNFFS